MKKTLLAAALFATGGSAFAGNFYLDPGVNYDAPVTAPAMDKVCDTCTSMKDEFLFVYDSQTTIFDFDANGIDAGDGVSTNGGLAVSGFDITGLSTSAITGFTPNEAFGANSNNGYGGSNWQVSFSISNLLGTVTGVTGADVPLLAYGSGLLELFITTDGVTFNNFMDINVAGAVTDGVGTLMGGTADFTNVDAGFNDLFHSGDKTCNGSDSFFDIWTNCGESMPIDFIGHFDTAVHVADFTNNQDGTFTVETNHDGSGTYNIPEPSTVALLGGSLLLMGAMSRRKSKKS